MVYYWLQAKFPSQGRPWLKWGSINSSLGLPSPIPVDSERACRSSWLRMARELQAARGAKQVNQAGNSSFPRKRKEMEGGGIYTPEKQTLEFPARQRSQLTHEAQRIRPSWNHRLHIGFFL